jgi:hypothetical protein
MKVDATLAAQDWAALPGGRVPPARSSCQLTATLSVTVAAEAFFAERVTSGYSPAGSLIAGSRPASRAHRCS